MGNTQERRYGELYIKYPNGDTEKHIVYTTSDEKERLKQDLLGMPPTVPGIWESPTSKKMPTDGEIVIGIELSGTPLECRYNYVEKRWEAFDFQTGNWFPVTLAYWTKCPI